MKSLLQYINEDVFDVNQKISIDNYRLYDDVVVRKIDKDSAYIKSPKEVTITNDQIIHYISFKDKFGINKFVFNKKLNISINEKEVDFDGLYFWSILKDQLFMDIKGDTHIKNLELKSKYINFTVNNKDHWDSSIENKNYQLTFENVDFNCTSIYVSFGTLPKFINCKCNNNQYHGLIIEGGDKLGESIDKTFSEKNLKYSILDFDKIDDTIKKYFVITIEIKKLGKRPKYYTFYHKTNNYYKEDSYGIVRWIGDWKISKDTF